MTIITKVGQVAWIGLAMAGCSSNPPAATGADASQAIKECAATDALPMSAIVYVGPTGAGPGSEWVRLKGGFMKPDVVSIGALPSDIFGNPVPERIFLPNAGSSSCTLNGSGKVDLGATFGADIKTLPISASVKGELSKGKVLTLTADGFEFKWVKFIVYNEELAKLPISSPYRGGGSQPNLMAAIGMLQVKNYVVTLDVSQVTGVDFSAKYSGALPKALTGDLNATVTAKYDGKNKLELRIPTETYVAAVLRPVNPATGMVETATAGTGATTKFEWNAAAAEIEGKRY